MAKIYAPNRGYTGVSASIAFCNGVGETENAHLVEWFREHGYQVEDQKPKIPEQKNGRKGKTTPSVGD